MCKKDKNNQDIVVNLRDQISKAIEHPAAKNIVARLDLLYKSLRIVLPGSYNLNILVKANKSAAVWKKPC